MSHSRLITLARAVARRFRRSRVSSDDLRQEATLAMLAAYRAGESDEAFLVNVARQALRKLCHRARRDHARSLPEVAYTYEDAEAHNLPDAEQGPRPPHAPTCRDPALESREPSPFESACDEELLQLIYARLPMRQAGAVVLSCWHGMSDTEIGERLLVSRGAATQLRNRGLATLRDMAEVRGLLPWVEGEESEEYHHD